uniref:Uncharacterized protein n=1 Tax=Panagrolaimus superbus TaxID=310955 RepID=A0A914ZBM4_9BILA
MSVSRTSASESLSEIIRVAHLRFIERISQLFGEIQSSQDIIPTDNEINHRRGKRSIVAASLGAIATSAIWYFVDNVRNVNSNLNQINKDIEFPAIKEQQLYVSTTIINIGFFVEHEFARYNTPELSVTVNGTEYAYSLKNCTMKVKLIVTTLIINFTRIIGFISFMSLS